MILAHMKAVEAFRGAKADGSLRKDAIVGMSNNMDWREPASHSPQDIAACFSSLEGQAHLVGVNSEGVIAKV